MAVGFPESCADVQIAQYEGDVRTSKEDLMKPFASTLGVPVEIFTVPVLSEPREYESAKYWRYELGAELAIFKRKRSFEILKAACRSL